MNVMDRFRLDGRVALVTGARRGLGRAFAQALGEVGARVAISSRDAAEADRTAGELRAAGVDVMAVTGDVTRYPEVEAMVAHVESELGPVDVLVNNAGIVEHKAALDVQPEGWREVLSVNLDGVWYCSQVVGRTMAARRRGVIVNIGSISGMIVNRPQWQPSYNASKAAVHQLTRSLAAEWAEFGVRVNTCGPRLRRHRYVAAAYGPAKTAKMGRRRTDATHGEPRRGGAGRRIPGE